MVSRGWRYVRGRRWCRGWPGPGSRTCWRCHRGGTGGWGVADAGGSGGLARASPGEPGGPLESGQVRVDVRAAGVNFLDVFVALGLGPGQGRGLGAEGAGVVTATGPGADGLNVGDAVMGIMPCAFGPVAVTDHRLLVNIPDGWSIAEAATVPVAFATAYYALVDLAGVRAGGAVA